MPETNLAGSYIKELKNACPSLSDNEIQARIAEITAKRIDEIRSTETNVKISGNAYYVSGNGNDENDGKTPETPWKTMARVTNAQELSYGDGVFFRRGEVFRGQIITKPGVTYSAYGDGEKPKLFGWDKNSASPTLWLKTDVPGVWEYAETYDIDVGNIIFDDKDFARKVYESNYLEDGTQNDYRTKEPFKDYRDLTQDKSFWHDANTGRIYLRYNAGNPAIFHGRIEMTKREAIIRNMGNADVTIDNLCMAYGNFGIASGTCKNLTVQNCEIKWIGGCIQSRWEKTGRKCHVPYGNGIEIYGGAYDFTVDNNYIWQNYDAAATNQLSKGAQKVSNKKVRYTNNVMENCVYSVELFFGDYEGEEAYERRNDDTLIENNIMCKAGGFGHISRIDPGCTSFIRCGTIVPQTTDFVVRNNIFDRSRTRIVLTVSKENDGGSMAQYYGNIYVQPKGYVFAVRNCVTYRVDEELAKNLEATGTEHEATFVAVDELGFE